MQQTLIAGDTLNFTTSVADYPASAGWVLKHRLVPRTAGGTVIALTGTADGALHRTTASAAITGAWGADTYGWTSWVELGTEVYSVDAGQIVVLPNPRTLAAGADTRSLPRKTLDDLLVAKAGWDVSAGRQRRYKIGEREMEFQSAADIEQRIRFWEAEVAKGEAADRLAKGLKPRNRILVRIVRPS